MPFIEKSPYVQFIGDELTSLIKTNGWTNFLKYRAQFGNKYADVRLFRSVGSDLQTRYLGMAHGYDTDNTQFSDSRHIFQESPLGLLGYGDGVKKGFNVQVFPIDDIDPIYVYVDGSAVALNSFSVQKDRGYIEFNVAPAAGSIIRASYKLGSKAPEPPTYLVFFTFSAVYLEKLAQEGDPDLKIADGDGATTVFFTPNTPIKSGTLEVYVDSILVDPADYTVDLSLGRITFNVAPTLGKEITVKYKLIVGGRMDEVLGTGNGAVTNFNLPIYPVSPTDFELYRDNILVPANEYTLDKDLGIVSFITAPSNAVVVRSVFTSLAGGPPIGNAVTINDLALKKSFNPLTPEGMMSAVYSSLDYLYPSLPTTLSFTSAADFGRAWQRDSLMHIWGNFNKNRIAAFIRADASGGADLSYFVPLYAGRLLVKGNQPRKNMVLIGGCKAVDEIVWAADKKLGPQIVDYGGNTANGNDHPVLHQAYGGAYYQKCYFQFITHSAAADNGEGKFNPSVYTEKYHFSRIRLVHPNDGVIGELDDMYAVHPKNIYQKDELDVEEVITLPEELGFGDGTNKVFHTTRTAKAAVAEVASLTITAPPAVSSNVTVTLGGVATNVAVQAGVAEVASLTVTAATASENVTVTLNGVSTNVAVLSADTAIQVADKIRAASFAGWTTGGTTGTETVTFTAIAVGVATDATYSAGTTGATGIMSTTTQGVAADTSTDVATKIRATAFAGWTTGGIGTTVTFTAAAAGSKVDATYSAGTTGATGTMTTTTQGAATLAVTVDCIAVPATDYTYDTETKRITFTTAPAAGLEVQATYTYKQRYRYTLATTPRTPFRLDAATPFNPIGVAILKTDLA